MIRAARLSDCTAVGDYVCNHIINRRRATSEVGQTARLAKAVFTCNLCSPFWNFSVIFT